MNQPSSSTDWFLNAEEPWVRLGAMTHLLEAPEDHPDVQKARREVARHPMIQSIVKTVRDNPKEILTNHKSAKHTRHQLALLGELGLRANMRCMKPIVKTLLAHQAADGPFLSWIQIPKVFGGEDEPCWAWMLCDAPLVLNALGQMGMDKGRELRAATRHLCSLSANNGWRCTSSFEKVRGPGRKEDACPYGTLLALKALSRSNDVNSLIACRIGTESLLSHFEHKKKRYLFGIGTDFEKLKFPFVWYDILHVVTVLSRFPWTHADRRFGQMVDIIYSKADDKGRFIPESVWMAYKAFDFGQKKTPSPTLTLVVERIRKNIRAG